MCHVSTGVSHVPSLSEASGQTAEMKLRLAVSHSDVLCVSRAAHLNFLQFVG